MPDASRNLLQTAIDEHRHGDIAAAAAKYAALVAASTDNWDALYLHGTALLQLGRLEEAIEAFSRAAAARPEVPDVHNNMGVACQAIGDWQQAARSYQAAIKLNADYDRAFFNLGRLMESRQLLADAEKCFRRAAALKPADAAYRQSLCGVLGRQNKWAEVESIWREAVGSDADNLDFRVNHGYALVQLERLDEAADVYRHILIRRPEYHEVHSNLGFVLERQGKLDEALVAAHRAVEIRLDYAEGFNNLGMVLRSMHRLDDACQAFRKAVELQSEFALAEFNLGTTLLLAERYADGWAGYRQHGRVAGIAPPAPSAAEWDGEAIPGRRLLVYADQGFGDTIQFARFLPEIKERSQAHVIFRCQSALVDLFAGLAGIDKTVAEDADAPECDFRIPLASLPGLLAVTVETAARGAASIRPPQMLPPESGKILGRAPAGSFRVGLVWQGNPSQARDVMRSCRLEKLVPLLEVPGVSFFSLQTGEAGRRQIAELQLDDRLPDIGAALEDFAQTAAILAELDLLITVDTAAAHLAGAIGRPVWTLLCHTPDWRWHLVRGDSPWYPSMRLFRQSRWGDWNTVVSEVRSALVNRLSSI